jgi:hypothetical protein
MIVGFASYLTVELGHIENSDFCKKYPVSGILRVRKCQEINVGLNWVSATYDKRAEPVYSSLQVRSG